MMNTRITVGNRIGSGAYGNVYSAIVGTPLSKNSVIPDKVVAIKYIEFNKFKGLESLIETYIVRCLHHKSLIHALNVTIEDCGKIKIMFPLAQCDTATVLRKRYFKIKPSTLTRWFWEISTAVAYLHSNGIIHGDIKGGNILVFGPQIPLVYDESVLEILDKCEVRLADFSLSVLVTDPKEGTRDMMRCISYTGSHRATEVWKGDVWGYPADIWALGCTFYELQYAVNLFPDHRNYKNEVEANILSHEDFCSKNMTIDKGISIPHQSNSVPKEFKLDNFESSSMPNNMKSYVDFKPCNISPDWYQKSNGPINDLILSMIMINPNERYSIWDVVEHSYFSEIYDDKSLPLVENRNYPHIKFAAEGIPSSLIDEINTITLDKNVKSLALSLYLRSQKDSPIQVCVLVAHKLLYKVHPSNMAKITPEIRDNEILLCRKLNFALCPHVDRGDSPMLFNNIIFE